MEIDGDHRAVTHQNQVSDMRIRHDYAALAEAAAYVGSVQIRNRATLAGNICTASPPADTAPALLVYGARVVAVGQELPRAIVARCDATLAIQHDNAYIAQIELDSTGFARAVRDALINPHALGLCH